MEAALSVIAPPNAAAGQPAAGQPASGQPADGHLVQSGMPAPRPAAARAGFLPLPLDQVLVKALAGIPVHLGTACDADRFPLYCSAAARFTEFHRRRLKDAGVRFIYIPMNYQGRFQEQVEKELIAIAADPAVAISTKSTLVYETSIELIDQVLSEQGVARCLPRLDRVARAVSTLVVNDGRAFPHLFATAQHDFYTATHMVNVGTWMTALAFAMGVTDEAELNALCTAGMLHDVGKVYVPEHVLNKAGALSEADWLLLRAHPVRGAEHLRSQGVVSDIILRVTLEHHERMDGTGYPRGLRGDQLHPLSKICAVVDSFDAMTACRPFKNRVKTIAEAVTILQAEAPHKYDPAVVAAWVDLLKGAAAAGKINEPVVAPPPPPGAAPAPVGRRAHERYGINCPAVLHPLLRRGDAWEEGPAVTAKAHNISRGGVGLLAQTAVKPGQFVRLLLRGKGTLDNRTLEGMAVRCRPFQDGWHDLGIKFCAPAAEEQAAVAALAAG
jgi:HD-GYP domain-containing protein (c-di-GMP phosphodiesterase class II)